MNILTTKELQALPAEDRIIYLKELRKFCLTYKKPAKTGLALKFVKGIYPNLREYDYEKRGEKNIPPDGKAIFVVNHSNSHDFFTSIEVFQDLGLIPSVFAASDDLNFATNVLFDKCNAILADRNNKNSTDDATLSMVSRISNGSPGVIHGEATWNLHPYRPMQKIKLGAAYIAVIAGVPIIPTTYEYIEVDVPCKSESDLYKKCVVTFGQPIIVQPTDSLIDITQKIQSALETMRLNSRKEFSKPISSLEDVDPITYVNHTWLKKFRGFGFTYDSNSEAKFLYPRGIDNEYRLNENGILVPGITEKEEGKKFVMKGV